MLDRAKDSGINVGDDMAQASFFSMAGTLIFTMDILHIKEDL
jgi:hypothetical protein